MADSRTEFTFNAPVDMPGVTLPPGTYVFRLADADTGRKVMQVLSKDSSNKSYGIFMTNMAQRPEPSSKAELRFLETPAGAPRALRATALPDRPAPARLSERKYAAVRKHAGGDDL